VVGSKTTAAYNLSLVIPKILWLGARLYDLRLEPPRRTRPACAAALEALLKKPWVRAGTVKMQHQIEFMAKSTGGIEDMGEEFELGGIVLEKIKGGDFIYATKQSDRRR
jgi:hypothetical protein